MMTNYQLDKKIDDFIDWLLKEPKDKDEIKRRAVYLLDNVYKNGYRHSYANITAVLIKFRKQNDNPDCLDVLGANIQIFKDIIEELEREQYSSEQLKPLTKLYDHVTLEHTRANYLNIISNEQKRLENSISKATKQFKNEVEILKKERENLKQEISTVKEEIENLKKERNKLKRELDEAEKLKPEVITIIGIFSAITLAFVGGMSFTSSTLSSINQSSIYRLIFIASICGLVMFNTIFCLMYIIAKMLGKNIYARCLNSSKDCFDETCEKSCSSIERIRRRLPYIYWINILLIGMLFLDFVAWLYDLKFISIVFRRYIAGISENIVCFMSGGFSLLIIFMLGYLFYKIFKSK